MHDANTFACFMNVLELHEALDIPILLTQEELINL